MSGRESGKKAGFSAGGVYGIAWGDIRVAESGPGPRTRVLNRLLAYVIQIILRMITLAKSVKPLYYELCYDTCYNQTMESRIFSLPPFQQSYAALKIGNCEYDRNTHEFSDRRFEGKYV